MRKEEANKSVIRWMLDTAARSGLIKQAEFFAERVLTDGMLVSRETISRVLGDIAATFPDIHFEPCEVVAEGDWVVARTYLTGTHLGTGQNPFVHEGLLTGTPPTGRKVRVRHIHMFRLEGGLIAEHQAVRDDVDMMRQLGLMLPGPMQKEEK